VTDPRVYEVLVALVTDDGTRTLTQKQSCDVIDNFEAVRHEATRFRLMMQRPGRLLIIEPRLIAEIEKFLGC
jgi:hypothetical protein